MRAHDKCSNCSEWQGLGRLVRRRVMFGSCLHCKVYVLAWWCCLVFDTNHLIVAGILYPVCRFYVCQARRCRDRWDHPG